MNVIVLIYLLLCMPLAAMQSELPKPKTCKTLYERVANHVIQKFVQPEQLQRLRDNDKQERTRLSDLLSDDIKGYLTEKIMQQHTCQEELVSHYHNILDGHTEQINSLTWSPDSKLLAAASYDHIIYTWNSQNDSYGSTATVHIDDIDGKGAIGLSSDGSFIALGSQRGKIRIWNVKNNSYINVLAQHENIVSRVAWSPNSKYVASGSWDCTICIWDSADGSRARILPGHEHFISALAWSPNNQHVASGSHDNTVRIWKATDGNDSGIRILRGHEQWVWGVAWSPNGNTLASASCDNTVRIWNTSSGICIQILNGHTSRVSQLAWSPNGQFIASGSSDKTVRIWHSQDGNCVKILSGHKDGISSLAWSPDDNSLASGSSDKTVRIWDLDAETKALKALNALNLEQFVIVLSAYNAKKNNAPITLTQEEQTAFDAITSSEIKELVLSGIGNNR